MRIVTHEEWLAEGKKLFGEDMMKWRFVCPSCGHVASTQDYKDAGMTSGHVAFSCIGRSGSAKREAFGGGEGPCNYAGGGLIGINPLKVVDIPDRADGFFFEFATSDTTEEEGE